MGVICSRSGVSVQEVWNLVAENWDYTRSLPIVREMFCSTPKYQRGREANQAVATLREEWERLKLGKFDWPFSQNDFDGFVQRINNTPSSSGEQKDEEVKKAAVKFRRLKEINTYRNDYIETLIFENNDNILPTLSHSRMVDFYIDGISFDQKVSRSVTAEFKRDKGENWKEVAKQNPMEVARYLYERQNEGRFDANPRLLVVYLDEDISADRIAQRISEVELTEPQTIKFEYKHRIEGKRVYRTQCIVVLLYN